MKIEVSAGELVDKYSILSLKVEKIKDHNKKEHVFYEKNLLHQHVMRIIEPWFLYYKLLHHVNLQIWDKTDEIKGLNMEIDTTKFAKLASDIFQCNDRRFRMKRIFNLSSKVKEQKSYANKTIYIMIPDKYPIFKKLDELIYMVLEYDHLYIKGGDDDIEFLSRFIPPCCLFPITNEFNDMIPIHEIIVQDEETLKIIHHFTNLHA